jgi:hypothetical protein
VAIFGIVPSCSTAWSVITGVPAILLGYQALKKIAAEPGRFTGLGRARAGIVLGYIGCAIFGFWSGRSVGHSSTLAGVAATVCAVAVLGGLVALAAKDTVKVLLAISVASPVALFLVGSVAGVVGARADAATKIDLCNRGETDASTQLAAKNFAAAHTALKSAQDNCADTEAAKLTELDRNLTQQEQVARKADADRATAAQAAAAAAKEQDAVQTFPKKSTEITAAYRRALNDTYAGKWTDADNDLSSAETELSSVDGTSVAQSKPYLDLSAQLAALRKRIDAQLEQIAKQKAAKEAAAEAAQDDQTLRSLLAQYKDNEVRADAIYKGKTVQFGGLVNDIKKDILDHIFVTVGTGEWLQIPEVQCFFTDSKAGATARLTNGQHVRMRGTVKGLMMNVLVEDCDIVH